MKKLCLFLLFISNLLIIQAQSTISKFLFDKNDAYVLKENKLFEISKRNNLKNLLSFQENNINDALIFNQEIWLCTDNGIHIYRLNDFTHKKTLFENDKIMGITIDSGNKIWFVSFFNGVYKQDDKNPYDFTPIYKATTNYDIKSGKDNSIYVATDYGLCKILIATNNFIRYTEEAHSGQGLPDNLVEKLFIDDLGNLWVLMPEHITYIKNDDSVNEFPTFSYIGKESNNIYQIFRLKNNTYMMLTDIGTTILNAEELNNHSHSSEVFNSHQTEAILLDNKVLNAPKRYIKDKIISIGRNHKYLYFLTKEGVWKTKEKKILKKLNKNHSHKSM